MRSIVTWTSGFTTQRLGSARNQEPRGVGDPEAPPPRGKLGAEALP